MKLTARLAFNQLKVSRKRTFWTILGILLSTAMLTAVCGFAASAKVAVETALGLNTSNSAYNSALIAISCVFGTVIIVSAVIVVSNAFRVSAGERTRQFGILKSVGATKGQIAQIIIYEGLFVSVVAIPVGILVGLFTEFVGTFVITDFLNSLQAEGGLHQKMEMPFVVSLPMFAVAVVTSLGTVLLSAWLPARKASRIPAIDAIRAAGEVKIKRKSVKTSALTQKLFGFEGVLAAKTLKRNRRNFRATVIALTISIILLIVAGSFSGQMNKVTNLIYANINASTLVRYSNSNYTVTVDENGDRVIDENKAALLGTAAAQRITTKFSEFQSTEVFGKGISQNYNVTLKPEMVSDAFKKFRGEMISPSQSVSLITVDAAHYAQLCEKAGVPTGSNILVNRSVNYAESGRKSEYAPINFNALKNQAITLTGNDTPDITLAVSGELRGDSVPTEVTFYAMSDLNIIVPECDSAAYEWFVSVKDSAGFEAFEAFAKQTLSDMSATLPAEFTSNVNYTDIAGQMAVLRHFISVVMFFIYGFVGMLTLIALTSVISTIGANVRARSGEFAVLESVGMTQKGLRRMLNLESILCSVRSLMYGVPLGLLFAYGVYNGIGLAAETDFVFPWLPVLECCVGVFAVTWVTMRYTVSRLSGGSIMDAIRE